jgi:transcriptional regulator with XRE-family HTH domain
VDFADQAKNIRDMDVTKRFAHNLIEQRNKAGLAPEDLAGLASIKLAHLEAIEKSEEQPELETLAKLAGSLGVPVGDLMAGLTWDPGDGFRTSGPR